MTISTQSPAISLERQALAVTESLTMRLHRWLVANSQGPNGAFHAWRETETGTLSFEYPEITGYALTYLSGRHDLSSSEVSAGRRAASWVIRRLNGGDFSAREGWDEGAAYNFDLAMISAGLINFGTRVDDAGCVKEGVGLADLLRRQIMETATLPTIMYETAAVSRRDITWSTAGQAHMVKAVQALLLADANGLAGGREAAQQLVTVAYSLQDGDGRFYTQPFGGPTMLHPHLYTIEGLWMWGLAQGDLSALDRACDALRWAWGYQLPTGGFPRYVATDSNSGAARVGCEQMDATAQIVRMTTLLHLVPDGYWAAVMRLNQVAHSTDSYAALVYHPGASAVHLNTWATMFGTQALELAMNPETSLSWSALV